MLDLAFLGSVTLLDLGSAGVERLLRVLFRGTRCASDTVATGAATEHNDNVAGLRTLATHLILGHSTYHSTDFQTFGLIVGVIDFANARGGQTDLVTVRGVTRSGGFGNHRLREFARQRSGNRGVDVARARDTQSLIHITASAQRVADGSAHAGSCTTERLNFRRVVVRLVLVHQQPVLLLAIDIHLHADAAGVILFGNLFVGKVTALKLVFSVDGSQVHQRDRTFRILAVHLIAHSQILT